MEVILDKRIIYKRDDGGVSVIIPTGELSVEETAKKDVPYRDVFTQTGTAVLTQEEYDSDPEYWDAEGVAVGETYPVGTWEREQHPYKIVDVSEIPSDRSMRDAWTVDEADLTDGVGA